MLTIQGLKQRRGIFVYNHNNKLERMEMRLYNGIIW